MPIRDSVSNQQPRDALNANITSNTTTSGATIDTADFDLGVFFTFHVPTYTDGSYAVQIFHGNASDMSDEVAVPTANLIGSLPTLSAATASGAILNKVGIFGTNRYVRVKIVSTSVTSGARIVSEVLQRSEIMPAATS